MRIINYNNAMLDLYGFFFTFFILLLCYLTIIKPTNPHKTQLYIINQNINKINRSLDVNNQLIKKLIKSKQI